MPIIIIVKTDAIYREALLSSEVLIPDSVSCGIKNRMSAKICTFGYGFGVQQSDPRMK